MTEIEEKTANEVRVSNPSKNSAITKESVIILDELDEVMTPPINKEPMPVKM